MQKFASQNIDFEEEKRFYRKKIDYDKKETRSGPTIRNKDYSQSVQNVAQIIDAIQKTKKKIPQYIYKEEQIEINLLNAYIWQAIHSNR